MLPQSDIYGPLQSRGAILRLQVLKKYDVRGWKKHHVTIAVRRETNAKCNAIAYLFHQPQWYLNFEIIQHVKLFSFFKFILMNNVIHLYK